MGKLLGMQDDVWGFHCSEGTEEYSVQTQWQVNREAHWLILSLSGVRLGSQMTYAAPGSSSEV
jgi:hypothetical protein